MDLLELRSVVAVADYCSFTKAANKLFVSQPTLSQQILKVEQELGYPLFIRTTRNVATTSECEILLKNMRSVLNLADQLMETAQNINPNTKGTIHFGIPIIDQKAVARILSSFVKTYPDIHLILVEDWGVNLINMLDAGTLDAAMCAFLVDEELPLRDKISYTTMYTDFLVFVMESRHPLADRKSLTLAEMQNERFIFPEENSAMKKWVFDHCDKLDVKLQSYLDTGSISTVIDFVAEGTGIAVISSTYAKKLSDRHNLVTIPISPPIQRAMSFITRDNHNVPTVKLLREYMINKI